MCIRDRLHIISKAFIESLGERTARNDYPHLGIGSGKSLDYRHRHGDITNGREAHDKDAPMAVMGSRG